MNKIGVQRSPDALTTSLTRWRSLPVAILVG